MNSIGDLYLLESIKSLHGLKSTAEKAISQINEAELHFRNDTESNNVAILMQHIGGNMLSRFTDFLTTDGEKEWRRRDDEFEDYNKDREELFAIWNKGWNCMFETLAKLNSDDLVRTVYIRDEAHLVIRAIQRQLVHYAYHTGQIVYLCKQIRSGEFQTLSLPKKINTPPDSNS